MNLVAVDFKSNQLEVVEETQSVVIKDICDAVGLNFTPQFRKLQSDNSYESKLIKVKTNGGMQEVFTIPLSKLNGWLFSINPNKVKPEVKQKLIEYKKECFDVLNNYFNKGYALNQNHPNLKKVIAGLKSGMTKKDKIIERLKRELDQYKYEQIALPNFSADEKLNIIMKRTDELLSKDTDNYSFTTSLQKHLKFYREYITAIKTGGDEFERFQINQIELARKLKNDAETREMNLYVKYNDMLSRIRGFIKASNQIALLEPLEEVKPV